jgi:hypothetical protein
MAVLLWMRLERVMSGGTVARDLVLQEGCLFSRASAALPTTTALGPRPIRNLLTSFWSLDVSLARRA